MSESEDGITEQSDLWIPLLFSHSKLSYQLSLDSFHALIISRSPVHKLQRHKIAGLFSSFSSAQRITKFLSTLTLHSPTENRGALIFLSVPLENIPSWCARHGVMHEQEEPLPIYTQQQRKIIHTLRRTTILPLLFPPLKRNKKSRCLFQLCWPDNLFSTWQDLKNLSCRTSLHLT